MAIDKTRQMLEESVLMWAITDSEQVPKIVELDEDLFSFSHTRQVHQAMLMLWGEGEVVSLSTVKGQMAKVGMAPDLMNRFTVQLGQYGEADTVIKQLRELSFRTQVRDLGKYLQTTNDPADEMEMETEKVFKCRSHQIGHDIGKEGDFDEYYTGARYTKTGIDFLDLEGGIYDGEMMVLAARPGIGKSTIALNIAINVLQQQRPVYLFTREMMKREVTTRILTNLTGVPYHDIIRKKMSPQQERIVKMKWDEMRDAWKGLLFIDDKTVHAADIPSAVRGCGAKKKMGLIIYDYIGLFQAEGVSDNARISKISWAIKDFSQRYEVPSLALAQLNREVEKRKSPEPVLSDLRDSGALEQDANSVVFAWAEEYGQHWLTKAKNRNGSLGRTKIFMKKDLFRVSNGQEYMVNP